MIHPVDLKDDDVWAMFQASWSGDLDQVKALVARRPELAVCEYNYTPPIHFAVREGHLEIVRFLLEQGSRSDLPDVSVSRIAGDHGAGP